MKYLGALLILCGCIGISHLYETVEKVKIKNTKEIRDFVSFARNKIDYFLTPVDKLLSEFKSRLIDDIYNEKEDHKKYLIYESIHFINDFFKNIGNGIKNEQIKLCDFTLKQLDFIIEKTDAEYKNKIRIFRTLTIFGGSCIIILII